MLSRQAPRLGAPGEWITWSVLGAGFQPVPPDSPSGSAAALVPWCGSDPGRSPGAPAAAALAPGAPAEGRDTASRHCSSRHHLGPPWAWGVAYFLEDKGEKEHQLVLSDKSRLPAIETGVLMMIFLYQALLICQAMRNLRFRKMGYSAHTVS